MMTNAEYQKNRNKLIPEAERCAYLIHGTDKKAVENYNLKWTLTFFEKMDELWNEFKLNLKKGS